MHCNRLKSRQDTHHYNNALLNKRVETILVLLHYFFNGFEDKDDVFKLIFIQFL